ncbi:MAG TPA: pyruvate kinase [Burkholderiales bacterium]|nr:pyruvate kinase [Burkholderiales bacterium]
MKIPATKSVLPPPAAADREHYAHIAGELKSLRGDLEKLTDEFADALQRVDPAHRASARNLLHYLGLRRHDIRHLQGRLADLGVSSIGRTESFVLASLNAVIRVLSLAASAAPDAAPAPPIASRSAGRMLLYANTENLLGAAREGRRTHIMVTLPAEAAADYELVKAMLLTGMNCARINCAHDDRPSWERMVKNLRWAQQETGLPCRIIMELGGPKLRTGSMAPGPQVAAWRPQRDALGRVVAPAIIRLCAEGTPAPGNDADADADLPVAAEWLHRLEPHDRIEFTDARGSSRAMTVTQRTATHCVTECRQTAYVTPGAELTLLRRSAAGSYACLPQRGCVGPLPPGEQSIRLRRGDTLLLTAAATPGEPARHDEHGELLSAAHISCTLPQIFADVRAGQRIFLDDGKIAGLVRSADPDRLEIGIIQARDNGSKLLADKGINLPDSRLQLPALTEKDIADLAFVVGAADMVGLSFVREVEDIELLQSHLARLGGDKLGIVLKIETRAAFENLPQLLLAALRSPAVGVMIARGDLAVECGYERLAELQEEILWLCEAAHLPVIWATQVLEQLAKKGLPTRAEITDAAMSERAECVMLNKGPHIIEAIEVLDSILRRMQSHQKKKSALLRKLHW